ncbi:MAG: Tad domain-containing protein [Hyphomicrobium sp.]|nr:Tad domain-containing protein [Hyphomicrobium sp.]
MRTVQSAQFRTDTNGGVAIIFGLIIPVLIGFAGLGVDGAHWMMERNKLQAATDSAAISAAQAIQLSGTETVIKSEAGKLLGKVYGASLEGVRFDVQHPPKTGPLAGNLTAVAITAERDQPIFFLGLFGVKNTHVSSRSVAQVDSVAESCLLALSPDIDKAVEITGNSTVNLGCGIASNSTASNSVYLSGASKTTATSVSAVGDVFQSNGAKLTTTSGAPKSKSAATIDPYGPEGRNLQIPSMPSKCTASQLKIKANKTLSPGRYCGGIDMTGGTTTFQPGTYIIDGGNFKANGNATLAGTGVTFILTGTGSDIALLDVNGGAKVSLHAPKSGTSMDGVLFFQDPGTGDTNTNTSKTGGGKTCGKATGSAYGGESYINGNADMNMSGAIYFPNQFITISGGTNSNMSCLQVIAQKIKISGNSSISGTCDAQSGTAKMARSTVELKE